MKTIHAYKADPTGTQEVEDTTIIVDRTIPILFSVPLGEVQELHSSNATIIEEALYNSLPGGSYDQLLRLMLERKASLLLVSY